MGVSGQIEAQDEARRPSVADLVHAASLGDSRATEELARHALGAALRTAVAMLGGRQEAGDIAQEVAIEALNGLGSLREPAAFDPWLHRIAVRRTLRAAKGIRRRRSWERPLEGSDPWSPDWSDAVDTHAAVVSALMELRPRQRAAVVLRYVHGLSQREIAEVLECRPGTAGALVSRGLQRLREAETDMPVRLAPEKESVSNA